MININKIRSSTQKIAAIGSHPKIIQSILDFDYISGKKEPSIKYIIAAGRKFERYFFGKKEILLPVLQSHDNAAENVDLALILVSGRRAKQAALDALTIESLQGAAIFAEEVPEQHAIDIWNAYQKKNIWAIGPASVGLLIPEVLKLGAIGGIDANQITSAKLTTQGTTAVFSASGGMTNELINIVASTGGALSFSLAFGGERFPIFTPQDAFTEAENDDNTQIIVYFGELGGQDEYIVAKLLKEKKVTKKVIAYIAGEISTYFEEPPQFGHAKAMAQTEVETASAKRKALRDAGAIVPESFKEFVKEIESNIQKTPAKNSTIQDMQDRKHALIASSVSRDVDGNPTILGEDLLKVANEKSFAAITSSLFLGKYIKSQKTEEFVDFILKLLVDHGPYVSGALNSIVTARAGKDLTASLASGVLTIGPRFGGAINEAAATWLDGAESNKQAADLVEEFASNKKYISGIGHRKYRIDMPDPRVAEILKFADSLKVHKYTDFAREVEKVTTAKKGNLILNVDGAIAAVLMDILSEEEEYSSQQLRDLIDSEFFNALFIASRSIGFLAHALDQKRLDEGLLRLPEDEVAEAKV